MENSLGTTYLESRLPYVVTKRGWDPLECRDETSLVKVCPRTLV